ncbi:MAG: J domain-containing protein [Candidatus Goldiibacteriota bacterium]
MSKKKYSYKEIIKAKEKLGLPDRASLGYIKKRHKDLVKEHHPDKNGGEKCGGCEEQIKEINKAYEIIKSYIENYEYSFSRKAVAKYNPEAGSSFRNYDDPYWGG